MALHLSGIPMQEIVDAIEKIIEKKDLLFKVGNLLPELSPQVDYIVDKLKSNGLKTEDEIRQQRIKEFEEKNGA